MNKEQLVLEINNILYELELSDIVQEHIDDFIDLDFDKFIEKVKETISNECFVYNSEAIKYLMRHDASLKQSLDIANDLGYKLDNLDSIILANLLYQHMLYEQLNDNKDKLKELKNKIEIYN